MSKRKRRTRTRSQQILWLLSLLIVASMVISLVVVALPSRPAPAPTPLPTSTPAPLPSPSPTLAPAEPLPTSSPTSSPVPELTEPIIGPALPTDTPAVTSAVTPGVTPTITITPTLAVTPAVTHTITITPTLTVTPSASSLPFTFAVCGDSLGNPHVYGQVLEAVMADGSRFLLHTGDLVSNGTESQWQEFQGIMGSFSLPFYPVPGNHDALDGQLDGFLQYSGAPAAHYSFDQQSVHFVLADSHHGGITAKELAWVRDDLSATSLPVKVVLLHHPPFDPDGTDHIMAFGNDGFMSLMAEQQVDYVFAGHIHAYAQEEQDGVVYTITGGAGAPLYRQDHPQSFHHYLRVTVQGEEVTIEIVKI